MSFSAKLAGARRRLPWPVICLYCCWLYAACAATESRPEGLCPPGLSECVDGACTNLLTDREHCGDCGLACEQGLICVAGSCELSCAGGTTRCGSSCRDLQVDNANCGSCGNPCTGGEICSAGQCGLVCVGGTTRCGNRCVDLQLDPAHCGGCDEPCAADEVCSAGSCGLECVGGTIECDGWCVDPSYDERHCNGCGLACDPGQSCAEGLCCDLGLTNCGGACVDLASDLAHCGDCDQGCSDTEVCTAGECSPPVSCLELLQAHPAAPDGTTLLDPDGAGSAAPYSAYCDMSTDGGGWTLIARFSNADAAGWMLDSGEWWYDRLTEAGSPSSRGDNADALSTAFWTVPASELKISRTDNPTDAHLLRTSASCLGGLTFREHITSFGDFRNGVVWGSSSVQGSCTVVLGSNYATTLGFKHASCTGSIASGGAIHFWTDYGAGDGAVIMIGGGGDACGRADHGIGVTEADAASFVASSPGEGDFGDGDGLTINTPDPGYALNLFVR